MNVTINKNFIFILSLSVLLYVFYIAWDVVSPFIASFVIAYLLSPVSECLHNKLSIPRWLSSLIIVVCLVVLFVLLWVMLVPLIYEQISHFANQIPKYKLFVSNNIFPKIKSIIAKFDPSYVGKVQQSLDGILSIVLHGGIDLVNKIWRSGYAVINIITIIFLVPLISFYMIRDWDRMYCNLVSMIPMKNRSRIDKLFKDMNIALSGFIRGQLNICVILAVYYSIALNVAGLKYGTFIGITTGLVSFIPFIGLTSGFIASAIVAYFQFASWHGLLSVVVVFLIGNVIESVISPKIVGDKVGLHPVWIIFALFLGAVMFGFFGMFVAIPVAALVGVLVKFFIEMYKSSSLFNTKQKK